MKREIQALASIANRKSQTNMTRQQVLDLYFLDARHKLIELAAFLDRVERAGGRDDFRLQAPQGQQDAENAHTI